MPLIRTKCVNFSRFLDLNQTNQWLLNRKLPGLLKSFRRPTKHFRSNSDLYPILFNSDTTSLKQLILKLLQFCWLVNKTWYLYNKSLHYWSQLKADTATNRWHIQSQMTQSTKDETQSIKDDTVNQRWHRKWKTTKTAIDDTENQRWQRQQKTTQQTKDGTVKEKTTERAKDNRESQR